MERSKTSAAISVGAQYWPCATIRLASVNPIMKPELVIDARANLGEGPIWCSHTQRLYWVDINGFTVHVFDPQSGEDRSITVGQHVGSVVPRQSGGVLVALRDGFAALDLETEQLTLLVNVDPDPRTRFNDGKCDPAGRFWAGTMPLETREPIGHLYRLDTDLTVTRVLSGVTVSNGIVWTADCSTMYYIDTATRRVDAFDYDHVSGSIDGRRPAIDVPEEMGKPDGSTLDAEGMLWVAHFYGGRVTRWNPVTGTLLEQIMLPVPNVTACAFGGVELDQLFITTARAAMDNAALAAHPQAGGVFVVRPGVRGVSAPAFAG